MKNYRRNIIKNSRGASLVDYALLVALISIAAVGAVQAAGKAPKRAFCQTIVAMEEGQGWWDNDGLDHHQCWIYDPIFYETRPVF